MTKLFFLSVGCLLLAGYMQAQEITRLQFDSLTRRVKTASNDPTKLFTLLRMAEFHIGKPGERQQDLDSARNCIALAKNIAPADRSVAGEGYILLVESLLEREEAQGIPPAKRDNLRAIEILRTGRNQSLLGKAWMSMSWFGDYRNDQELAQKITYLENASICLDSAGEVLRQAICLQQLADLYVAQGNFRQAEQDAERALDLFHQAGQIRVQQACILLASAYSREYDYSSATKYALMSLKALKETDDTSATYCQVNNTLGVLFGKMQEYDKSLMYFDASLTWARNHHDIRALYILENSMVGTYARRDQGKQAVALVESIEKSYGPPADSSLAIAHSRDCMLAYSSDRQREKAAYWYGRMAGMRPRSFLDSISVVDGAIKYFVQFGEYPSAAPLMPAMRRLMLRLQDSASVDAIYGWLFRLDTGLHNYRGAVTDLLHYDRLRDSLYHLAKTRQISRLELDYATAEKENNIKLLQKEMQIQQQDIKHTNQFRNLSIAAALLIVLVLAGRYRIKQRQHRKLEEREREIQAKNLQLEKLLKENEWLLKEVHHRVKNNLQIVSSLLESQLARLHGTTAFNAVQDSQHRVQSIALLHQKLYKGNDLSVVDMEDYIVDMIDYLGDAAKEGQQIQFVLHIDPMKLEVMKAVLLGLIINEVVTNSIKYAFPNVTQGRIEVEFRQPDPLSLYMRIADNGIGLPYELESLEKAGFGMRLIHGLAEDLDASVELKTGTGTEWVFKMPISSVAK